MVRCLFVAICVALTWNASALAADPPKPDNTKSETAKPQPSAKFIVRDVNLYVMSAYGNSLNHRDLFKSTLPGFVGPRRATADRKTLNNPSPAGLITFEGEPNSDIDVLLEFTNGRFFGNWPPCPQKSKRLLWVKSKLTKEPGDVVSTLPENHWMTFLRKSDRLWFEAGRRSERFILYDAELPLPTPVKVSLAEGGHGLVSSAKYPLHDVAIYKPEGGQWLVGSLPVLEAVAKKEEKPAAKEKDKPKPDPEAVFDDRQKPAAEKPATEKKDEPKKEDEKKADSSKEAEAAAKAKEAAAAGLDPAPAGASPTPAGATPMAPMGGKPAEGEKKADDAKVVVVPTSKAPQDKAAITAAWSARLKELGLGPVEIEYLTTQIAAQALGSDSATIVFRLDDAQLEELFPLEVTPAPEKQVRVAIVVLLDSDPDVARRVEELVNKLGAPSYADREAAMEALRKLGPAAKQKVQEAVNNKDAEIAFRAEQLVEAINDPQQAQPRPNE